MHLAAQSVSENCQKLEFSLAGVQSVLHSNSLALIQGLSDLPRGQTEGSPGFAFYVDVRPEIRQGTLAQAHFRGQGNLVCAMFGEQELFVFDLLRAQVHAVVSESTASDLEFWRHTILPMTLGVLGLTRGVVPLHSACLARPGFALLLAGESGAGKSTLAVALAQTGWSLLSDDWTYFTLESSKLFARGTQVPVKLLADAHEHFPELHAHTPRRSLNGELAYEVPTKALRINFSPECVPQRLVFVERNQSGRTSLESCDPDFTSSFFLRWAERLPAEFSDHANELRLQIISRVAALDCWKLSYSGSPAIGAAAINDLGAL